MASLVAPLPGIGRIVSEMKLQKAENEYHSAAWDHGLIKPIKSASLQWTLSSMDYLSTRSLSGLV